MKKYEKIKSFDQLIETEHGKLGTESRNKYEEGSQMFIISEIIKETKTHSNYLLSLIRKKGLL